jgi:hypothetical protein
LQVLGLLLGYVVMMRTLNGHWVASAGVFPGEEEEEEEEEEQEENGEAASGAPRGQDAPDEEAMRASCLAALGLFLQSTPFLEPTFRPTSVDAAVQAWVYCQPPSLQSAAGGGAGGVSQARRATQAVLRDVQQLLSSWELAMFALLDCWLLGRLSSCPCSGSDISSSPALSWQACLRLACRPPPNSVSYAADTTRLLEAYQPVFSSAPPSRASRKSHRAKRSPDTAGAPSGSGAGAGGQARDAALLLPDKFTRKCYFLIKHCMQERRQREATGAGRSPAGGLLVQLVDEEGEGEGEGGWTRCLRRHLQTYEAEFLTVHDQSQS